MAQQVLQLTNFESVKNLPTASARARFELSGVVHSVSTEEAEVVEASESEGKLDEHA